MKKVIILAALILIVGIVPKSFAQKHEIKSDWFNTGSVLTYQVTTESKEYNYVITDLNLGLDVSFKWKMTEPVNFSGSIRINDAALDNAEKMINNFENGSSLIMNDQTTVMFSRKAYKLMIGQQAVNITIDNKLETIKFVNYESYAIEADGVKHLEEVMVATSESGMKFWILDNPKYPLIIKMEAGFTIELKSVTTAN